MSDVKTWKNLSTTQEYQGNKVKGGQDLPQPLPVREWQKASKRMTNEVSSFSRQSKKPSLDSLPISSGNEYRTLRRNYLLLEDERLSLGRQLIQVEDDIETLDDEKHALLDQLVVLEGLIDPSVSDSR